MSFLRLPFGGNREKQRTVKPSKATEALQTKTKGIFPTSASAAKTRLKTAVVDSLAMFSTRVIPLRASTRWLFGSICRVVPLEEAAVPAESGRKAATM